MIESTDARNRQQVKDPSAAGSPPIRVLLASPRGFCAGVRRAIDAVRSALEVHGAPVYVRRPIVHNREVVRGLEAEGAVFVEELEQVPVGSVVVLSAHGVAPEVMDEAEARSLRVFDAVCPLVAKVHREVERHHRTGRQIVVIGHAGHPEIEGTLARVTDGSAHLVNSVEEVQALPFRNDLPTAYAVQTTYSVQDAAAIVQSLKARFSSLVEPSSSDICYATTNRQSAVYEIASRSDAVIVVGEHFSSNATRLAEVAGKCCESVQLVAGPGDLDWDALRQASVIGISAAASTPESSVRAVIAAIGGQRAIRIEEIETVRESTVFKPVAIS